MTNIIPAIRGLQFMLDQYSGKRPYEGYPKALQDGITIINALSADLTKAQAEVAAAYERAAEMCDRYPYVEGVKTAIRALATPEQTAALDTIRAEVLNAAAVYMNQQYGNRALSNPIDRQRILDAITKGAKT